MKIDELLPQYEFNEIHQLVVNASPGNTIAAARDLQSSELPRLMYWMLNLRELPAILMGKTRATRAKEKPFLDQLYSEGFIPLAETGDEIVFGLVGQFWKLTGGMDVNIENPQAFQDFKQTDFAKVAANLRVEPDGENSILSTETRIWAPDPQTRKKFAFYWRLISFGNGWIRILWLRSIKRRAEKA
jgi:hypothetical protein